MQNVLLDAFAGVTRTNLRHLNVYGGYMEYWNSPNFKKMTPLKKLISMDIGYTRGNLEKLSHKTLPNYLLSYQSTLIG